MQPLIDERLQRRVERHPIGLLGEVERLVGMDRAEHAGMQLLLKARLRGVGDHQVGFAVARARRRSSCCRDGRRSRPRCRCARSKRSLVPPGLTMTLTPGRSISASVANFSLSAQRAIGVLPSRSRARRRSPSWRAPASPKRRPSRCRSAPASKSLAERRPARRRRTRASRRARRRANGRGRCRSRNRRRSPCRAR